MNGFDSYNAWNINLWITNDEGLYSLALDCAQDSGNPVDAARSFVNILSDCGTDHTPDGVPFDLFHVEDVMATLQDEIVSEDMEDVGPY